LSDTESRSGDRPVLAAEGLVKTYGGRAVVRDVSLNVTAGEIVGLLGPNGAGKTTTFSIVVGLVTPDTGVVRLGAQDVTELPMYRRARAGISYLPQEPSVFRKMTVERSSRPSRSRRDSAPSAARRCSRSSV
jgi:lipopolysaccharide export system ATP-binding protein